MIGRIFTIKKESKQLPPSLFYCCNYLLRARKSSRGGKRVRISELLLSIPLSISSCPWEGKAQGSKGGSRRTLLHMAFSGVNAQCWPQPGCSILGTPGLKEPAARNPLLGLPSLLSLKGTELLVYIPEVFYRAHLNTP